VSRPPSSPGPPDALSAPAQRRSRAGDLGPAFAAVRVRLGLVLALFALAAIGWWWTTDRMRGMDDGPWTGLGALGWFLGVWVAGATLLVAALYELTPLKDVCLGKCRSPLGFLLGPWRDGPSGALRMGAKHGAWCVGCCWALMASLFALGVMSVAWMAFVAGLIAVEKTVPWRRTATYGTAALLLTLGVLLLTAPGAIPGLTLPGGGPMDGMEPMGS
jgi:predicted metal-binding integral membrane protein DUF2182